MDHLKKLIQEPVLLALSGGADSTYLYHQLKRGGFRFAVAHIDHRWRDESKHESEELRKKVEEDQIPFFLATADESVTCEASARHFRLQFFKKVCQERGLKAVLMAHHYHDQVETVLKRVVEGASMVNLGGMQEVSRIEGLKIIRPCLNIKKEAIIQWLNDHSISYFEDSTNHDQKYLRARLRQLEKTFQKEIHPSLHHLGKEANALKEYLEEEVAPYFDQAEKAPWGTLYDFSHRRLHAVLIKHFLRQLTTLSRQQVETASEHLASGSANKRVGDLILDRKRVFLLHAPLPNKWSLETKEVERYQPPTDWRGVWQGEVVATLPKGEYQLSSQPPTPSLKKMWSGAKVPSFLYKHAPLISHRGKEIYQFLTNRQTPFEGPYTEIRLIGKSECDILTN